MATWHNNHEYDYKPATYWWIEFNVDGTDYKAEVEEDDYETIDGEYIASIIDRNGEVIVSTYGDRPWCFGYIEGYLLGKYGKDSSEL